MRKKLTAVILALLVFSLIAASAASLGGVRTDQLGADVNVVASCDIDGVDVAFNTTYVPGTPTGTYEVGSVDVSDIHTDCDGQTVEVTLADGTGAPLGVGTANADLTGAVNVSCTGVDAVAVEQIGIIISG